MATILVVDDRPDDRQLLVTLIGYYGHRMIEAIDGAEALQLARAEHPDLIISDILMPTMDGYEFVRRSGHRQDRCDFLYGQLPGTRGIGHGTSLQRLRDSEQTL
jgi:CheY-like chemotaxis protein